MSATVATFTDTYLPTVNGVSYTIDAWRQCWTARGGRMDVVYPAAAGHDPRSGEHPVRSLPFPFYEGYRIALPAIPAAVREADVLHVHTPFTMGAAALWARRRYDLPLVASYHTPTGEYTGYLSSSPRLAAGLGALGQRWERSFLDRMDLVLAPSQSTRGFLRETVGTRAPLEVLPNGIDVDRFRPVHPGAFLHRHDLPDDEPLVGYTGRHGQEKRIDEVLRAAAGLDVTVVIGGDGPARPALERLAEREGIDARFLGFLDREELPAFYSALDVFAFPSPVETQGIVALEAMACGTPVVAADAGALRETVEDGVTGLHFEPGDVEAFRTAVRAALERRDDLRAACLERRAEVDVERTIDRLAALYDDLLADRSGD